MDDLAPVLAVLIVFGFVTHIVKMGLQHQQKKLNLKETTTAHDSQLKQEVLKLKQRVETLEKIVTDNKYDLKKEIDKLDVA